MEQGQSKFQSFRRRQFLIAEEEGNQLNPAGFTPELTPRQRNSAIQSGKDQVPELVNVPTTSFLPATSGAGIFGIGLLAARVPAAQEYQTQGVSPKNIPIITKPKVYSFFFIEYANPNVARGLEGEMLQFAVIITQSPVTVNDVSQMLRLPAKKITPLTAEEYAKNSFNHPTYINDSNTPLQIRYAEVPIFRQKTPGRLDNIALSYPAFDNTPDYITTRQGPVPSAPYTNFATSTGCTSPINVALGGTVFYLDTSPLTPWQFAPTGWYWEFGPSANPTGSTQQNVVVSYNTTGSFTVQLTASNAVGSQTLIRTNFVTII